MSVEPGAGNAYADGTFAVGGNFNGSGSGNTPTPGITNMMWNSINAITAAFTVASNFQSTVFNDSGATVSHTNTLPPTFPGTGPLLFAQLTNKTNDVKVLNSQDRIQFGSTLTALGGECFSTNVGSVLVLFCPVTNIWLVMGTGPTNFWVVH
jgi:hypothetical protein